MHILTDTDAVAIPARVAPARSAPAARAAPVRHVPTPRAGEKPGSEGGQDRDAETSDDEADTTPLRRALTRAPRREPIGDWLRAGIAAARAIAAFALGALAGYRQYRMAKASRDALLQLDDRMLRDLGLHRDEVGSVAAELSGQAERTRIQTLLTAPGTS
ncbi:MAG: DUF1127 domain-containing protein [Casimicrobiaceae bacterium]